VQFDKIIKKLMFFEDSVSGGKADNKTPKDIARKHGIPVDDIILQIAKGIKVETEHTKDHKLAKEIAMDHLIEFPDYYDRLKKMEDTAKKQLKEMINADVVGGSGTNGAIAPQDNIGYASGDSRMPKSLFGTITKDKKNKNKNKKRINVMRRPKIGM